MPQFPAPGPFQGCMLPTISLSLPFWLFFGCAPLFLSFDSPSRYSFIYSLALMEKVPLSSTLAKDLEGFHVHICFCQTFFTCRAGATSGMDLLVLGEKPHLPRSYPAPTPSAETFLMPSLVSLPVVVHYSSKLILCIVWLLLSGSWCLTCWGCCCYCCGGVCC